jgi:hypothetical protein
MHWLTYALWQVCQYASVVLPLCISAKTSLHLYIIHCCVRKQLLL